MKNRSLKITYIGGPTALFELGGLRLLTDPTFDPAGTEYPTKVYTLKKSQQPARSVEQVGRVDAVLLSHDHHFDNLDRAGRQMLATVPTTFTTVAAAERLGGNSVGLAPWQKTEMPSPDGRILRIVETPARHGPADGDRGPVIGFVLSFADVPDDCVYISGDTVWYEGVAEVAKRFQVTTAVLFMGAAVVKQVGPAHLTMNTEDAVRAAHLFASAKIVPLHYEGWAHFSESRKDVENAFAKAGLQNRLHWLEAGVSTEIGSV